MRAENKTLYLYIHKLKNSFIKIIDKIGKYELTIQNYIADIIKSNRKFLVENKFLKKAITLDNIPKLVVLNNNQEEINSNNEFFHLDNVGRFKMKSYKISSNESPILTNDIVGNKALVTDNFSNNEGDFNVNNAHKDKDNRDNTNFQKFSSIKKKNKSKNTSLDINNHDIIVECLSNNSSEKNIQSRDDLKYLDPNVSPIFSKPKNAMKNICPTPHNSKNTNKKENFDNNIKDYFALENLKTPISDEPGIRDHSTDITKSKGTNNNSQKEKKLDNEKAVNFESNSLVVSSTKLRDRTKSNNISTNIFGIEDLVIPKLNKEFNLTLKQEKSKRKIVHPNTTKSHVSKGLLYHIKK